MMSIQYIDEPLLLLADELTERRQRKWHVLAWLTVLVAGTLAICFCTRSYLRSLSREVYSLRMSREEERLEHFQEFRKVLLGLDLAQPKHRQIFVELQNREFEITPTSVGSPEDQLEVLHLCGNNFNPGPFFDDIVVLIQRGKLIDCVVLETNPRDTSQELTIADSDGDGVSELRIVDHAAQERKSRRYPTEATYRITARGFEPVPAREEVAP